MKTNQYILGFDPGVDHTSVVVCRIDDDGLIHIVESFVNTHVETSSQALPEHAKIDQENALRAMIRRVFSIRPRTRTRDQ